MSDLDVVGWREWISLPDLNLLAVRCKIDTGAATSAIHADDIEHFVRDGEDWARFIFRPFHRRGRKLKVHCEAPIIDSREVISSSGHAEERIVIRTLFRLGTQSDKAAWPIELTLADRSQLRFPMLLGRQAMQGRILVDSGSSYVLGQPTQPKDFYRAGPQ